MEVELEEEKYSWPITSIYTWINHEYYSNGWKSPFSLVLVWIFTISQVYLMVGLSLEFYLYDNAVDYQRKNKPYFCDKEVSSCIGNFHYRTIMALVTTTSIILVNVVNEYEQINVQFMGDWIFKGEQEIFTYNSIYAFFLNLLFPFRCYVILIAVLNSTMNLLTTDIGIPSVILNGLSMTFILSVDDLVYMFHTGQAKSHSVLISPKKYDYIVGSKYTILFLLFLPTIVLIYLIIDNEYYVNNSDMDQYMIMGCCLYCLLIFFFTRIKYLNIISKRSIITNILIELVYLIVSWAIVYPLIIEYYINEIKN